MTRELIIAGASGFGREVAWLAEQIAEEPALVVVCFVDDDERKIGTELNGIVVKSLPAARVAHPGARIVVAIGDPAIRRSVVDRAAALGCAFETLIHPRVERSRWLEVGHGTVICAGCILTTNIQLGRHVQINLDCTIGHDVTLDDYATLAPGVHVSGNVRIETGAYVGTGASIINGREGHPLVIGAGAVVGAAACVTRDVPPGTTVVGVPAKRKGP